MAASKHVTVEKVGETQDSDMDVFEARAGDSYMNFSFDTVEEGIDLRVYTIHSDGRGGMKRLLDHVCGTYGCETVRFVNVISDALRDRLDGFEEKTVRVPDDHPSPAAGEPYQVLDGEWHVSE